jgi:hypothetical protein
MAEKAMDEAAERSLFLRKEEKVSAAIIQLFFAISGRNMRTPLTLPESKIYYRGSGKK